MNVEQPLKSVPTQEKIIIAENKREIIEDELVHIEEILNAIEAGDKNYAYADTESSMENIDSILLNDQTYQKTLSERKEASIKSMQGNETEKNEGLKQAQAWVEKIKGLLMGPNPEQNQLAVEIGQRADNASGKVKQRVIEIIMPKINQFGDSAERWLVGLQNDFYILAEDPNDPCGGGNYQGWTADEIKELYLVLYGEDMD